MSTNDRYNGYLERPVLSRRAFLKLGATAASMLALPTSAIPLLAEKLARSERPPVIWLSFQECTGCTESLTRSHAPTIEALIFDYLSLDYHHTLQAASGTQAESARMATMDNSHGNYILIVDGSIPTAIGGAYSTIAGKTNLQILSETTEGAATVIAIGTCAAFGGLPAAEPNPTGAVSVGSLMEQGLIVERPLVNIPGCPPLPVAISSVLAHLLAFGTLPELDELRRPLAIYGNTVHERCSRYHFFTEGKFVQQFDDEGARKGWCLYKLGCKGPVTHNACATFRWNQGTSSPIESGHPCIGCSEPNFWDRGNLYTSLEETDPVADPSASGEAAVRDGQGLYEDNCVYCHSPDPSELADSADQLQELFSSDSIRAHQRLQFSDEQLNMLDQYLRSNKVE